ncbi:heterokaryon incompatibility protein-domain-containing protein [Copromyces sp. CBS 386.78]|nr:heterokaryon incompatibility protein-domain-containing protein [Copromyces sp. CBS 386.78]
MAEEDLSVSVPTKVPPQTSTGFLGISLSSQNAPVAAPNAPRQPTELGSAARSGLSDEWNGTDIHAAPDSDNHPWRPQPRSSEAASNPDAGYTDNDDLCDTCRFLVQPRPACEGWEVKYREKTPTNDPYWSLTTRMTWSENLMASLFDEYCPLCDELCYSMSSPDWEFLRLRPTQDQVTVVKRCNYLAEWNFFSVELSVKTKNTPKFMHTITGLYPASGHELDPRSVICYDGFKLKLLSDRAIGNPGPFGSNTGSDLTWELVGSWMAKCLSSHQACNQVQSVAPPLPTRVIDVGSKAGSRPPYLHVVTENATGRYATLSHRWASEEPLKLEVNNLQDFQQEIPVERLPKSFQDAIEATRRLGIQYIWIDSLCIIQDSPDGKDWAAESAKMTTVYENSYVNFAATHAMDSTRGCFFDREPSQVRPIRLHVNWKMVSGYYYAAESHGFTRSVARAPLYQRGWVYQERTLAPRIIHCTDTQLYWECLESIASESFPTGLPHSIHISEFAIGMCSCSSWRKLRPPASDLLGYMSPPNTTSSKFFDSLLLWNMVVAQYAALDLTFQSDKLVAISGLAKMHSKFLDTKYLAGMWLAHLPEQLLWYRGSLQAPSSYSEYVAPSWSWASIPTRVQLTIMRKKQLLGITEQRFLSRGQHFQYFRPLIQVLDATINLLDESHPFGAVSRGALRIKGPLATSSLIRSLEFDRYMIVHEKLSVGSYNLDTVDHPWQRRNKKALYFLAAMLDWEIWGSDEDSVSGLLLQKTDHEENVFQRIGVFDVKKPDVYGNQKDGIQMLQEACRSQNGTDDDGPFPEWGKQQVVTII